MRQRGYFTNTFEQEFSLKDGFYDYIIRSDDRIGVVNPELYDSVNGHRLFSWIADGDDIHVGYKNDETGWYFDTHLVNIIPVCKAIEILLGIR